MTRSIGSKPNGNCNARKGLQSGPPGVKVPPGVGSINLRIKSYCPGFCRLANALVLMEKLNELKLFTELMRVPFRLALGIA